MAETAPPPSRFVGLDVSPRSVVVAAIDAAQTIVLPPKKIALSRFLAGCQHNLQTTDSVVLEATGNAWALSRPTGLYLLVSMLLYRWLAWKRSSFSAWFDSTAVWLITPS